MCVFQFTAEEFLYQNQWGGISLLNAINLSERVLMSNTTFVSINKLTQSMEIIIKNIFFFCF